MNVMLKISMVAALSFIVVSTAYADTRDPGVNKRQHNQRERIQQGVESGALTRSEANALRAEQRAIRAQEREFRSDGVLTRGERRELHRDLNESSRDIRREKHDNATR